MKAKSLFTAQLTFVIALALILGSRCPAVADVALAPGAPIVKFKLHNKVGGDGGDIDLSRSYKNISSVLLHDESTGAALIISGKYEVLSYDSDHVKLSMRLVTDLHTGAGTTYYTSVVDITKSKAVVLTPFPNVILELSMVDGVKNAANP